MIELFPRFENSTFDTFKPQDAVQQKAVDILLQYGLQGAKTNVFLTGNPGTGKTHLLYALARAVGSVKVFEQMPEKQWIVGDFRYFEMDNMIARIKAAFSARQTVEELLQPFCETPLLLIDEIGLQYGTEMERIEMKNLFDYRWKRMLPTIATSNLSKSEVTKKLGLRICDRFFDDCKIFEFTTQSRRGK